MQFKFIPYSLNLKEPFGTAHGTRTSTEGMLVALTRGGITGFGEVFMPPYYPENQKSFAEFFQNPRVDDLLRCNTLDQALADLDTIAPGNAGAKTALDIALHDLFGKEAEIPVRQMYKEFSTRHSVSSTSFTIGIDTAETMVRKAREATGFKTLKIKLDGIRDIEVIKAIQEVSDQRLFVDANQAWTDVEEAIDKAAELFELGVGLIEQPFAKGEMEKAGRLRDRCSIPVIADEDVQTAGDIARLSGYYDGINIKLMKAGGIREAHNMIGESRRLGLKVLLGCMTESSIGISAAVQLAHLADWCDLDGNLLIKNDTCKGVATIGGELRHTGTPGIGITDDATLRSLFEMDS